MPAITTTDTTYQLTGADPNLGHIANRELVYKTTITFAFLDAGGLELTLTVEVARVTPAVTKGPTLTYLEFLYEISNVSRAAFGTSVAFEIQWGGTARIDYADYVTDGEGADGLLHPTTFTYTNSKDFTFTFPDGLATGVTVRQFFVRVEASEYQANDSLAIIGAIGIPITGGVRGEDLYRLPGPAHVAVR